MSLGMGMSMSMSMAWRGMAWALEWENADHSAGIVPLFPRKTDNAFS
jgi:hypothetical protein